MKIADLIRANTDAAYTRELMTKEFAGTATLRQLLELDDEMLLRVGAGMRRGIWFGTAVFDGAKEDEIKAPAGRPHCLPRARARCSTGAPARKSTRRSWSATST